MRSFLSVPILGGVLLLVLGVGVLVMFDGVPNVAHAGDPPAATCTDTNGDVDGSGAADITDAINLLRHLFLGNPPELLPLCETPCETAVPSLRGGLPDTGQTTCYDEIGNVVDCESDTCFGQDGFYLTSRFLDHGDGTVTDTHTGLMWQKDIADVNDDGESDVLDVIKWGAALEYCENLELAGHNDWRLPNAHELQSIVNYGVSRPSASSVFGTVGDPGEHVGVRSAWTSTSIAGGPHQSWIVGFNDGIVLSCPKEVCDLTVRAVRLVGNLPDTGQTTCYDGLGEVVDCDDNEFFGQDGFYSTGCPSDEDRFVDDGDGTVTDTCTGLTWQKDLADVNDDGESDVFDVTMWCAAVEYCENLELAGHNDWRLPNVRELHSLQNYEIQRPSAFPVFGTVGDPGEHVGERSSWNSTTIDRTLENWINGFNDGIVLSCPKTCDLTVRAVRSATN